MGVSDPEIQKKVFGPRWQFQSSGEKGRRPLERRLVSHLRAASFAFWRYFRLVQDRQLKGFGQPSTMENRSRVAAGLSAAYDFEKFLWNAQKDLAYDFFKHSSDKEDFAQLHYLADTSMYFVTGDTKLQKRIAASPQATRVLQWRDLYKMAKGERK